MEQTKFRRFKRIIFNRYAMLILACLFIIGGVCIECNADDRKSRPNDTIEIVDDNWSRMNIAIMDTIYINDSIQNELVDEVKTYIQKYAPQSDKSIPQFIVEAGLEHNIDICFMMAQTQIETHYGTAGIGRKTSKRSMFGVMGKTYASYEDAIFGYCQLLKRHYLGNGRTEHHLMKNYVTKSGGRYAENPNYEKDLKMAYENIKRTTGIYELQQSYIRS